MIGELFADGGLSDLQCCKVGWLQSLGKRKPLTFGSWFCESLDSTLLNLVILIPCTWVAFSFILWMGHCEIRWSPPSLGWLKSKKSYGMFQMIKHNHLLDFTNHPYEWCFIIHVLLSPTIFSPGDSDLPGSSTEFRRPGAAPWHGGANRPAESSRHLAGKVEDLRCLEHKEVLNIILNIYNYL